MKFLSEIFFIFIFSILCLMMFIYYFMQHVFIIRTWITGYGVPEDTGWVVLLIATLGTLVSFVFKHIYDIYPWLSSFVISMTQVLFFNQLAHIVVNFAYSNSSGFFLTTLCNIFAFLIYFFGKIWASSINENNFFRDN
ncbi:MAG: hypothetical protein ACRCWI_04125 [Brevinema sp.]